MRTRVHALFLKIMSFFRENLFLFFFVVIACLKQYKGELDLELFSQESKKYRGSDGKTRTC